MPALLPSRTDSAPSGFGSACDSILPPLTHRFSFGLGVRFLLLALLFGTEYFIKLCWRDAYHPLDQVVHWIGRCIVCFAVMFLSFAFLKHRTALVSISRQVRQVPIRWSLLGVHCLAMGIYFALPFVAYGDGRFARWSGLVEEISLLDGVFAIALAGFAFLSWGLVAQLIRSTGHLWAYASVAAVSASFAAPVFQQLWRPASYLTLRLTTIFLRPFVSDVVVNPSQLSVGTHRFAVDIASGCSGLECVGLLLVFGMLWLMVFREECRFPQSLVLIPLAITISFLLNAVRIAALILIGNAGAPQIALGGFHSQAGWITFSLVGVAFCVVVQQVPWFTIKAPSSESLGAAAHNPTTVFLLPFLLILAAGMISTATKGTGGIEWLYPLRFFAAIGALWFFRSSYKTLSWKFDWLAPAIGALVFVIWVGLDRSSSLAADRQFSAALLGTSAGVGVIWFTFRVLAAVVTVPLAEELAFRGFLMRRLISSDFDSVSFRKFSWFALLASSLVFGILHGGFWIAGCISGILFGLLVIRRGRIGEAVVAHATANALLAAYVLIYHQWHLW